MASGVFGCSDVFISASSRRIVRTGALANAIRTFGIIWTRSANPTARRRKGSPGGNLAALPSTLPSGDGISGQPTRTLGVASTFSAPLSRSDRSWLAGILASPAQGRLDPKAIIHAQTLRRRRRTLSWVPNNAAAKTELPRREQTANWPFASSQKILRWELSDRQVLHNFARLWMPVFWDSPQCIRLAGEG